MVQDIEKVIEEVKADALNFAKVIEFIESRYIHQPTAFSNGEINNEASQNQGSAKVFAFAKMNNLTKEDTLCLFAEHYQAVLKDPDGEHHQNIRQFMHYGWEGIRFAGEALRVR